ncbi:MAG: hypothetical protein HUU57_11815 [Bdellovibrio sp.]|nr:hypothetical protein [Bdellovibrio sp.]
MKRFLLLSMVVFGLTSSFSAFAQSSEKNRPSNPGVDRGEEKTADGAGVANIGMCNECVQNMVHGRLQDNTNPVRGSANTTTGEKPSSTRGEQ